MSAAGSARPDPDGHHDDLPADDLAGLSFVVPDDARELSGDRDQWLAESPVEREWTSTPQPRSPAAARRRRLTITAALLIGSLLVVALSGTLAGLLSPTTSPKAPPSPLATPAPAPGQVGGLLPSTTLVQSGEPVPARALRPAVIVLLPDACNTCVDLVRELRRQAAEFGYPVNLVGGLDQSQQLSDLGTALGSYRLNVLSDPDDTFASTYGLSVPTLILVRDDGLVVDIVRDPPVSLRLEAVLATLSGELAA